MTKGRKRKSGSPSSQRGSSNGPLWGLEIVHAVLASIPEHGESPTDAASYAQILIYEAWEMEEKEPRVAAAHGALAIDPNCADALSLLAEDAATWEERMAYSTLALIAAERSLPQGALEDDVGLFWGLLETRPYMRAKLCVAMAMHEAGHLDGAIDHYREMLRLNPNDNQGARYFLAGALVQSNLDDEALALLMKYRRDVSTEFAYLHALIRFRKEGPSKRANAALSEARRINPHVPGFLLGAEEPILEPSMGIAVGSIAEAVQFSELFRDAWTGSAGAIDWLREIAGDDPG